MKKNDFALFRAQMLVLTNVVPEGAALYLILFYGRAHSDVPPLYPFVADSFKKYGCPIVVNGADGRRHDGTVPRESWPGGEGYRAELVAWGTPPEVILEAAPANNTATETESLLALMNAGAHAAAGRNVAIVAHPHQLTRIMATLIQKLDPRPETWPRFYSLYPPRTRWFEKVAGSQGERGDIDRLEHADLEVLRILRYQGTDCADIEKFEAYFRWLDATTA